MPAFDLFLSFVARVLATALIPIRIGFGLLAVPVRYVLRLLGFGGLVESLSARLIGRAERVFGRHPDPLLRGDLVAYAEAEYPPAKYPTAWADIPADLRRPLVWDGRLLNGRRVAELAKARMTDAKIAEILMKSGFDALVFTVFLAFAPLAFRFVQGGGLGIADNISPFPTWAFENGAYIPVLAWLPLVVIEVVWAILSQAAFVGAMALMFPVLWFFAFCNGVSSFWKSVSAPLRLATRDSEVAWKSNALTREMQYKAYCREVEQATGRLRHQPLIPVGEATGTVRGRGDMEAPTTGQVIGFDGESIRQHTLVLGGTGSGKTRLVIRPLFRRIMTADWGEGHRIGAYVTDGKGTLWRDLAGEISGREDAVILGTGAGQFGLDLVQGMTPLEVATTFKAVAGQVNGESVDSFWPESASLLLMHSATVAAALEQSRELLDGFKRRYGYRPYSLLGIAMIASEDGATRKACEDLAEMVETMADAVDGNDIILEAIRSAEWLTQSFLKLGDNTRGSIVANVSSVLGKLQGARELSLRFCSGTYERSVDVDHALEGGIVFVAVGETEHGMAGKVVTTWLKSRLYILARRRLLDDPEACRDTSCALFADEFQMLATVGPDSDSTFWNIARETGVFMVAATQSLAALRQAIGEAATANIVNLLRSKIILKTEEETTLRYAAELAGSTARGWEYQDRFYSTFATRELAEGNGGDDTVVTTPFACLLPSRFTADVTPETAYDISRLSALFREALRSGDPNASVTYSVQQQQQLVMRSEDKNEQAMIGGLQMRPKLDQDEFLIGSGLAFAIIQRAGGDRMDIIDLDIAA